MGGLAVAVYVVIVLRLFFLQMVSRPAFLKKAEANRIRVEVLEPSRGGIFDRQGQQLVENRPSVTLYARPWTLKNNPAAVKALAGYMELDEKELRERIGRRGWFTFSPIAVQCDIPFTLLAVLEAHQIDLNGIEFKMEFKRAYPLPEAVHLLGYVGERSTEDIEGGAERTGLTGKHGLERVYEKYLSGEPGIRYVQVDVSGKSRGLAPDMPEVQKKNGWNLYLNIDGNLQRRAYELMAGRPGAVIAMQVEDGGILTMLSLPDYDPTIFSGVVSPKVWNQLATDPDHPLLNRTVQGQYPPGSTYKMVVLTGVLEEGLLTDNSRVTCRGGLQVGNRFFLCWNKRGHGVVDWRKGIQMSCDVFFYHQGLSLGVDRMGGYARRLGFGAKTGIDFDVESKGVAPDAAYMDKRYGKNKWAKGQVVNHAIGQGEVLVTPAQLMVYTAAIATGNLIKPRLGDFLENPKTGERIYIEPDIKKVNISAATLAKIREGMTAVVNEPGGTAFRQHRRDMVLAGKTGTSQNPHGKDHALFVGYGPADNPKIAVAVVVEHGEHGSSTAAPIACSLMEQYIHDLYPGPPLPSFAALVEKPVTTVSDSLDQQLPDSLGSTDE